MRRINRRITSIYWLFDIRPDTIRDSGWTCGVPFYCGKTVWRPEERLAAHRYQIPYSPHTGISRMLSACGAFVRVDTLDIVAPGGGWAARERYWIAVLRNTNHHAVNEADGGQGPAGLIHSEETRQKIRNAHKNKRLSPEHIARIVAGSTGRIKSAEERARISASKKGCRGRKLTADHLAKLRAANIGRVVSVSTRKRISESLRAYRESAPVKPPDPNVVRRNRLIREMWVQGMSGSKIGAHFGLTKQRVFQILKTVNAY